MTHNTTHTHHKHATHDSTHQTARGTHRMREPFDWEAVQCSRAEARIASESGWPFCGVTHIALRVVAPMSNGLLSTQWK